MFTSKRSLILSACTLSWLVSCGVPDDPDEVLDCANPGECTATHEQALSSSCTTFMPIVRQYNLVDPKEVSSRFFAEFDGLWYSGWRFDCRHMGAKGSAEAEQCQQRRLAAWSPWRYTGLQVTADFQRGFKNVVGHNVYQWYGRSAGAYIDTRTFNTTENIVGGGPHVNMIWTDRKQGGREVFTVSGSDLVVQTKLKVPYFKVFGNGVAQNIILFYLAYGSFRLHYIVLLHDTRTTPSSESIMWDDAQKIPFVSTRLAAKTRYATLRYGSPTQYGTTFTTEKFFRAHITRQNVLNAIDDVNKRYPQELIDKYGSLLPRKVDRYTLTGVGWHMEIANAAGPSASGDMQIGASEYAVGAYECY